MYDVELTPAWFAYSMPTLNMKNVRINGGDWANSEVINGQWENVQIYPNVYVSDETTLWGDIKVRNVTFPEGSPWKEGRGVTLVESKTPFVWPEIKIPTPEELGLVK